MSIIPTAQAGSSLNQTHWSEAFEQALQDASVMPDPQEQLAEGAKRQISLRRMVFHQAEAIIAVHDQGVSYSRIADSLSRAGFSITDNTLMRYISAYRKQKDNCTSEQVPKNETREERTARIGKLLSSTN